MRENSKKVDYMEQVASHGQIENNIKVNILKTRSKVKVCLYGQMEENMKEIGLMDYSMELVFSMIEMGFLREESGRMAKEKDGLMTIAIIVICNRTESWLILEARIIQGI